jgi:hypothetical protein
MEQPQSVNAAPAHSRSAGEGGATPEALRKIVLRHCVCYEVWPEWSASSGRATRIGFALSLCGIHENGGDSQDVPGCPLCRGTFAELSKIADWITPRQERACRFEIGAFDRAWHIGPNARRSRKETIVTIRIFHRHDVHAPIDDCQQQCLNEMREKLVRLGVAENVWAG